MRQDFAGRVLGLLVSLDGITLASPAVPEAGEPSLEQLPNFSGTIHMPESTFICLRVTGMTQMTVEAGLLVQAYIYLAPR